MKPIVKNFQFDDDPAKFDSVEIILEDLVSFRVEHWEASLPQVKIHLSEGQFKELLKEMKAFKRTKKK